MKPMRGYVTNQ